jgi:hypothetical protein
VWPMARGIIGGASFFTPEAYENMGLEAQVCVCMCVCVYVLHGH